MEIVTAAEWLDEDDIEEQKSTNTEEIKEFLTRTFRQIDDEQNTLQHIEFLKTKIKSLLEIMKVKDHQIQSKNRAIQELQLNNNSLLLMLSDSLINSATKQHDQIRRNIGKIDHEGVEGVSDQKETEEET
eukprot:336123_1